MIWINYTYKFIIFYFIYSFFKDIYFNFTQMTVHFFFVSDYFLQVNPLRFNSPLLVKHFLNYFCEISNLPIGDKKDYINFRDYYFWKYLETISTYYWYGGCQKYICELLLLITVLLIVKSISYLQFKHVCFIFYYNQYKWLFHETDYKFVRMLHVWIESFIEWVIFF